VVLWLSQPDRRILSEARSRRGALSLTCAGPDDKQLSADAPSATIGVGYEVRVNSGVLSGSWINVLASSRVRMDYHLGFLRPPACAPGRPINVVQAGLGVNWH